MPIPLDDPRWHDLQTAYKLGCIELLDWLRAGYDGKLTTELLGDVINEIQHQGDTSTSMYAVAPHLLDLADRYSDALSQQLIIYAGLIHASASAPDAIACPAPILDDFTGSRERGLKMAAKLLTSPMDDACFKYLLAAIAGFAGHGRIARFVEGLEFENDGVWCEYLDDLIPDIQQGG